MSTRALACLVPVAVLSLAAAADAAPRPRKTPFQRDVSISVPAGTLAGSTSFTVPAGRRLVLEYASGSTRVHVSELVRVEIRTTAGGATVTHVVPPSVYRREFEGTVNPDFVVGFGQALRIYADPGTTVTVLAVRSENAEITPSFFQLAVSGHLVEP
jgi:hypothetical protein